jgi:Cft2 family RNA processing exonuclease
VKNLSRAFTYRAGIRLRGTIVACDATAGSDLIFVSHARALESRAAHALPRARAGRRQVLTTELTLALLGAPGERLRPCALLAPLGRPFGLGTLRLELFPSAFMPGSASLLCEADGRRVVYAGPIGAGAAVRPAQALCVDATFGARRFSFPARDEALDDVRRLVTDALGAGRAPIVLCETANAGLDAAAALAGAGVVTRAHRSLIQAAATFSGAGLAAPALQRFEGRLRPGEALLWPRDSRGAARLRALPSPAVLLASARAADPAALAEAGAEHGVALAEHADFDGLLRYIDASGASEVALVGAPGDELAQALRARGVDTYAVGPPRQIGLFAEAAAPAGT